MTQSAEHALSQAAHLRRVQRYYTNTESRLGYRFLLGETKHFGWYGHGHRMWGFSAAMRRMEHVLASRLDLPAGSLVLDAGCGVGDVARRLAAVHRLRVNGIDVLEFNIALARRRAAAAGLGGLLEFSVGDYHDLPHPDGCFDAVYTMETLVHAIDPVRVLAEFRRVLRPAGRLVMFEYSRTPSAELSREADEALRTMCELAAMPAMLILDHGRLEELLADAGFGVASVIDVSANVLPMLRAFALAGRLPYRIGRALHRPDKVVNALSGVEMYQHRHAWRYNIYTAAKP
ncbi:methyltransferase domain-containing protein [Actinomadura fulvescens]|uniref:Methyltransferase domain-containing protein n=1 Tax=Actinomadura fulvescens TaxID=46160 RepID=A0ABP6DGD5_9ACTN